MQEIVERWRRHRNPAQMLAAVAVAAALTAMASGADLVIRIPGDLSQQDGHYRLYYRPEVGSPAANTTFRPQSISDVIKFSRGLPGTKYDFWLYYSNSTINDWLTWTASITTAPDPPSNLSIDVK
jgi:receptor-type tyrosine-protein phosphatase beta